MSNESKTDELFDYDALILKAKELKINLEKIVSYDFAFHENDGWENTPKKLKDLKNFMKSINHLSDDCELDDLISDGPGLIVNQKIAKTPFELHQEIEGKLSFISKNEQYERGLLKRLMLKYAIQKLKKS